MSSKVGSCREFSGRVPRELEPNRLSLAVARLRDEGRPLLDLTQSNPTRSFSYPTDLLAPLAHARGLAYRPEPLGVPEARAAVAADFARRGRQVNPDRIALTAEYQMRRTRCCSRCFATRRRSAGSAAELSAV